MRIQDWLKLSAFVATAGFVKWSAVVESAWLYRVFLYVPAALLSVFGYGDYGESGGVYTFETFVLDYSCAGVNFFLITLAVGCLAMLSAGRFYLIMIPIAWFMTLAANTLRVGLYLKLELLAGHRPWLHEATGILVFLTLLVVYYHLLMRRLHEEQ